MRVYNKREICRNSYCLSLSGNTMMTNAGSSGKFRGRRIYGELCDEVEWHSGKKEGAGSYRTATGLNGE